MTTSILDNGVALLAVPELAGTGHPEWDEAFAKFIAADAIARADYNFGPYSVIVEQGAALSRRLDVKHGQRGMIEGVLSYGDAEADADWAEDVAETFRAEEFREINYLQPLWLTSVVLLKVPAPTLQAALFKIELTQREELHLDATVDGDPFEIIKADFERLRQPSQADPVTRYWCEFDALNAAAFNQDGSLPDDAAYIQANDEMAGWSPPTAADFVRKYEAMHYEGGFPNKERRALLERDVVALLGVRSYQVGGSAAVYAADEGREASAEPGWYEMLAEAEAAKKAEDEFYNQHWTPINEEQERVFPESYKANETNLAARAKWQKDSGYEAASEFFEALASKRYDLQTKLMATPAPDLPALRWKLDVALQSEDLDGEEPSLACWNMRYLEQTIADYRRLLGQG